MTPALVDLARQGDEGAIAQLLNHAFKSHHLETTVVLQDGHLKLGLEGELLPDQVYLVPLVLRGLLKLQIPGVQTVTVMGRELGGTAPAWVTQFSGQQRNLWKELVAYGDTGAIAHLLNRALVHKQISTQVQKQKDTLIVTLVANRTPDQRTSITLLQRELATWQALPFQTVEVRGQNAPTAEPQWVEQMAPHQPVPQEPVPASRPTPVPAARAIAPKSTKPPPAVWTFKFDYPKLALVGFLAFYGLFCGPHYNFSDFINGTNPLMMFIHGVNLIFHEAGHVIFSMFGQLIMLLAGSFMQIAVPAFICGYFFFTRQPYAGAVTLCWVGENFWDVSIYIKDAQERALPLLGGEGVLHDWHFILVQLLMLQKDDAIGNAAYAIGTCLYAFAIFMGVFYAQIQPTRPPQD